MDCEECLCKFGECADGIEGNGHCQTGTCRSTWSGDNCDKLPNGYMGDREGNVYKTVTIGEQTWMAENMNYAGEDVTCYSEYYKEGYYPKLDPDCSSQSECREKYGCLYNFDDAEKLCPTGWKLPSPSDFEKLISFVKTNYTSSKSDNYSYGLIGNPALWPGLKRYQELDEYNINQFGFSAVPAGWAWEGNYTAIGMSTYIWSNDRYYWLVIEPGSAFISEQNEPNAYHSDLSVRCLKD